jgi:hypothetical protein
MSLLLPPPVALRDGDTDFVGRKWSMPAVVGMVALALGAGIGASAVDPTASDEYKAIAAAHAALQEQHADLVEKHQELQARHRGATSELIEAQLKLDDFTHRETELTSLQTELDGREVTLTERESEIVAREQSIAERESAVEVREAHTDNNPSSGAGLITTGGDSSPSTYYANCSAVRAAGKSPIRRGDPGWQQKFDRDGDGVGCE